MSLQWTFVATFLYFEIFLVVLLLLPFISATRWQKIFKSRLLNSFSSYANLYFNIFIVILLILFLDSIRDVRRYSEVHDDGVDLRNNPGAENVMHMKLFRAQHSIRDMSKYSSLRSSSATALETMRLSYDVKMFRAQRNFYIAGFAVFLWLVLRRLVVLISNAARMEADVVATKKQAESASAAAKQMMEDSDNKANEAGDKGSAVLKKELEMTKSELEAAKSELTAANKNLEAMKKQAQSTNAEYDRLTREYSQLQNKLHILEGSSDAKKDA